MLATDPSDDVLRGLMTAVRKRSALDEEGARAWGEHEAARMRQHFVRRVVEHVQNDQATTDDVRAANMTDLLPEFDALFPASRTLTIDEILRRHAWRELDPTTYTWLVDGWLRRVGVSILSADPKVGKSLFARCLAVAISGGVGCFLNRPARSGPVLFFEMDEPEESSAEHLAQIANPGAPLRFLMDYGAATLPARRSERFDLAERLAREMGAALIVMDTLGKFTPFGGDKGISDYGTMNELMRQYQVLAAATDSHVALVHHTAKGEGDRRTPLGSQALGGATDANLALTREGDGTRYIKAEGRGVDIPKTRIDLRDDGWLTAGETAAQMSAKAMESDVLDFVMAQSEPIGHAEIQSNVSGKTRTKQHAIVGLVDSGRLIRTGTGTRGSPFLYSIPDSRSL